VVALTVLGIRNALRLKLRWLDKVLRAFVFGGSDVAETIL